LADERMERRLMAILAADVAGYSRLMGAAEEETLARLKACRRAIIDPTIERHRGRIVKTTGDGLLAAFSSVVDAVRSAIELQTGMAEHNLEVPPERRIQFRIGINLGDVVLDAGDMFGDGVNVAARLEAAAEPSGICISGAAYQHLQGDVASRFVDAGEQQLKNIARPVRIYRMQAAEGPPPSLPLPDRPSIAVLPFTNMSGDREQEYFADGITEDLIIALAHFRWFFVIARNSSFAYNGKDVDAKQVARELGVRYLLEGSVRRSANRVRITAQLIDAVTGNHIWAERYDFDLTDIFAIQDEITDRVAGAIEPELLRTEGRSPSVAATNMTAWDLVRRGMWKFHQVTRQTHLEARQLFLQAIRLDPQLPEAQLWLARVNAGLVAYNWSEDPSASLDEGHEAALKAVQLDERNPYSHYAVAIVSVFRDSFDESIRAAERSVEISPSFALGHLILGLARLFSGHAREAIAPLQRGLRLSPHDPQNFYWFGALALALFFNEQPQPALEAALRALEIRPSWRQSLETTVICYVALDRMAEARVLVDQIRRISERQGDLSNWLRKHNPHWAQRTRELLEKAGLRA
jgi:adenylate cyclase